MKKTTPLSKADREAMVLAIEVVRAESPASRAQIDDKLATEPWEAVGHFAAYSAQDRALKLRPWETPPVWIVDLAASLTRPPDDHRGERRAAELLKNMVASGVSRFHPDPLAAIEAAEDRAS
jgi:hypothetical protein